MKVVVAPNSFKGSLSCADAARAMARGVRAALRGARVTAVPVADGGDGLIDALRASGGGALVAASVRGPLGERRRASYLWRAASRTAVIETARATGLALLPPGRRRPLAATSRGAGDLIRDAVRRGARRVIVGLGGTAASDGGAGLARALGARLLDARGREIPDGAAGLLRLDRIEVGAVRALLRGARVTALADVDNRLLGARGSARAFGPQKGATPAQVRLIERALANWARVLRRDLGVATERLPGGAAAGGQGAGLAAFARARLVPGAEFVLRETGAARALAWADLAVTGEGRLDRTSLWGKAPVAVARRARRCVAVVGAAESGLRAPFARVVTLAEAGAKSQNDAMKNAAKWVRKAAALAVSAWLFAALPAGATDIDFAGLDRQYFHRHLGTNLGDNLKSLEALDAAQAGADGEVLWRLCRAKVRRTEKLETRKARLDGYDSARKDCEMAVALSSSTPNAHFWHGVAMGRYGETKGIMKALFLVGPIKRAMEETLRLDPAHGGAHHVLGEILWQLPGFAGGDKKRALKEFEEAVRLSPDYTANHGPLAEAYLHYKRRADAIKTLKAVEAVAHPADPAEYPENLADARKRLAELESQAK